MKSSAPPPGLCSSVLQPGGPCTASSTGWRKSESMTYSSSDGASWDATLTAMR